MSVQKMKVDPGDKWIFRVGGISAFIFGTSYVIIMMLFVLAGGKPTGAEAWLNQLTGNTAVWWAILGFSVLTDFLFVPIVLSLYLALTGINRNAMLIAAVFMALFIVLDLALTWPNIAVLITLSGDYATATNDAHRTVFVTAALYPSTVVDSTLLFVYNSLTLAIGILMTGFVMLKRIFNKGTAYLGLVTGVLGIIAVAGPYFISGLSGTIILVSALTTIWIFLVGHRLYGLSRQ